MRVRRLGAQGTCCPSSPLAASTAAAAAARGKGKSAAMVSAASLEAFNAAAAAAAAAGGEVVQVRACCAHSTLALQHSLHDVSCTCTAPRVLNHSHGANP